MEVHKWISTKMIATAISGQDGFTFNLLGFVLTGKKRMSEKQQIIDGLMVAWDAFKQTGHKRCAESVREAIEMLLDAPEVIRCRDCKHGDPCNDGEIYCEKDIGTFKTAVHKPDWFCADGKRREA